MRLILIFSMLLIGQSYAQKMREDAVYKCSILTPPNKNDSDPGISIDVGYENGEWFINHSTRSGQRYIRQEQYLIKDISTRGLAWQGTHMKRNNIRMVGEIKHINRNNYSYIERVYDMNKGGIKTAQINAECIQSFSQEDSHPNIQSSPQKPAITVSNNNVCKPGSHQAIPIIFEKTYDEARKLLIAGGWQPILASPQSEKEYASSGNGPELWANGFRELRSCAGTGMANCTFEYKDNYNNFLSIFTTGEVSLQGEKKVWNVVSSTSCRARN
jgi:hypothetical protein